jgi:hypothetical protein
MKKNLSNTASNVWLMFATLASLLVFVQILSENNHRTGYTVSSANIVFQKNKSTGHLTLFGKANVLKTLPPVSSEHLAKCSQRLIKIKSKTCDTYKKFIVLHLLKQVSACIDTHYLVHSIFSNCLYLLYSTLLI